MKKLLFGTLLAACAFSALLLSGCSGGTEETSKADLTKIDNELKDAPPPSPEAQAMPNPKPKIGGGG